MSDDAIKERFSTVDKEIEQHEKRLNNLEKTYQVMEKMEYRMEQMEKSITAINGKLDSQTAEKGKKWDKLIDYLFYFIIAALLGYIIHQMGIKQEVL